MGTLVKRFRRICYVCPEVWRKKAEILQRNRESVLLRKSYEEISAFIIYLSIYLSIYLNACSFLYRWEFMFVFLWCWRRKISKQYDFSCNDFFLNVNTMSLFLCISKINFFWQNPMLSIRLNSMKLGVGQMVENSLLVFSFFFFFFFFLLKNEETVFFLKQRLIEFAFCFIWNINVYPLGKIWGNLQRSHQLDL